MPLPDQLPRRPDQGTALDPVITTTTATIEGDVEVDAVAISTEGLIGKNSGGDFTVAFASATTLTLGTLPNGLVLTADDIVSVQHISEAGVVRGIYARDDKAMTISGATLTVVGVTFVTGDAFIIYTNVPRETTVVDTPEFWQDTSFVTGDSPALIDINAALGRNAAFVQVINDGAGNFTVAPSNNGIAFGTAITVKPSDPPFIFEGLNIDSLRITWVANSAYRVIAV